MAPTREEIFHPEWPPVSRALNQFTGRLPLVKEGKQESLLGTDTEGAIRAGVQTGLIFEINEYIRTFKNKYEDLGGNYNRWGESFSEGIYQFFIYFCTGFNY
ncbi:MAG: hypothetical protein R2744_05735 [Bacteroidales bacterium]